MPVALALVTALSRLSRSSMARRCVVEATAAPLYVRLGKARFRKFWVAVSSCGRPGLGDGWEALATNGRASMLLDQVTWSEPLIVPDGFRSQPAAAESGLLMRIARVPSVPLMVSFVP